MAIFDGHFENVFQEKRKNSFTAVAHDYPFIEFNVIGANFHSSLPIITGNQWMKIVL